MTAPAANKGVTKGTIGLLQGPKSNDLVFQFNPTTIDRSRRATYANNNAALADFPRSAPGSLRAIEWIRNEAEEFTIELIFHQDGDKNVETQLRRLDDFMAPNIDTKQPPDLVMTMGPRADLVRIIEKKATEKLFDPSLHVQEAVVTLHLKSLRSRMS